MRPGHTFIHTNKTCKNMQCTHIYIHTYTYIHTQYTNTYLHTHIHTYTHTCKCPTHECTQATGIAAHAIAQSPTKALRIPSVVWTKEQESRATVATKTILYEFVAYLYLFDDLYALPSPSNSGGCACSYLASPFCWDLVFCNIVNYSPNVWPGGGRTVDLTFHLFSKFCCCINSNVLAHAASDQRAVAFSDAISTQRPCLKGSPILAVLYALVCAYVHVFPRFERIILSTSSCVCIGSFDRYGKKPTNL